jgi:hypothetical protein
LIIQISRRFYDEQLSRISKKKLTSLIEEMATSPELFVENATTDFTRKRKLSFATVMNLIISMDGNSICSELMQYFDYDAEMASASAFIQQRNKLLPINATFDYLDLHTNKFYPISFRVVRFRISEDTYETIITNLDPEEFSSEKIKEFYHLRWGIETSFRELKYEIGLTNFHSKKVEHITQEIFARLTMYNFCELITMHVVIQQKDTKHSYQVNFTRAIQVCRYYFRCQSNITPPDVEALILKNNLPVRTGRKDLRKVKANKVVSFLYRVA